ncbi:periplasmic nitrate reductase, NapE protein [Marinimicrobium sp. ABcell2]|uniref:periplasmic nitrate reductase, NapE protein n=1 Tax=Marinimicrobium sp. ABcell2 TaxID=3069751 RepID=UPI0027B110DE|nr:periplasmic nitrate reductase, NapE protein [Marinimicrobium sp. ABcell2]MDQ2076722.1 periplasmic nitrate reductase, NapE protein [Marinimicrobium sp. ABcell2]
MSSSEPLTPKEEKRREWRLFLFIIILLFPILSVMIVGGFGFSVWMYQLVAGPPTVG